MPRVALRYEDGVECTLEAEPFETVYQAALRAGAPVLTDCLEGACATCKARCVSGEYDLVDPSFDALSREDESARFVLLCQMEARTECVVQMPYSHAFASTKSPTATTAMLEALEPIGAEIVRLVLAPEAALDFDAGQYARLVVPGTDLGRAYSFANRPGAERWVFYVRLLANGAMSDYLRERAAIGDVLHLESPLGGFYLRPGAGPVVLIAGGTGLAPMLAMLETLAREQSERPVTLLHGARRSDELFGTETVERLRTEGLALDYRVALDHMDDVPASALAQPLAHGPVTDLVDETLLAPDTDVYLCGPPPMVEALEARLAELGVALARVYAERFNPA